MTSLTGSKYVRHTYLWVILALGMAAITAAGIAAPSAGLESSSAITASGDGLAPMVTGSIGRDYARIQFEWPSRTRFTANVAGNKITLRFERSSRPDFGSLLSSLGEYVKKAEQMGDGKTVVLTLAQPYKIRSFTSGNFTGIDLLDIRKPAQTAEAKPENEAPAAATAAEEKKPEELKKVEALKPEPKTEAQKKAEEKKTVMDKKLAEEKKALQEERAKKKKEAQKKREEEKARILAEAKKAEEQLKESAKILEGSGEKAKPSAQVPASEESAAPEPSPAAGEQKEAVKEVAKAEEKPADAKKEEVSEEAKKPAEAKEDETAKATADGTPQQDLPVSIAREGKEATLKFDWEDRVSAAIFLRGNRLWVVFGQPAKVDVAGLKKSLPAGLTNVTQIPHPELTWLIFSTDGHAFPQASRIDKSQGWQIKITPKSLPPLAATKINPVVNPPLKPHLLVSALEASEIFTLEDQSIGDQVIVVPFNASGQGIFPSREYVEFNLPQTAQGMAVLKRTDDVKVVKLRSGLRIGTELGLTLTQGQPEVDLEDYGFGAIATGDTFFPYDEWKLVEGETFEEKRKQLFGKAVAETGDHANRTRLKLAQLHLAYGQHMEALGELQLIQKKDPDFFKTNKLSALAAAANFMMYRIAEAEDYLVSPELGDNSEMGLWRTLNGELLGKPSNSFDYLSFYKNYISKYPPQFRQQLSVVAGDIMINKKEYNAALKIFQQLQEEKDLSKVNKFVQFLIGKISAETGQTEAAIKIWSELVKDPSDRFVRSRAEFSLVNILMKEGRITPQEGLRRLDNLRIVWRGDNFELLLLQQVARMHIDQKNYLRGLKTYKEIVTVFPSGPEATEAFQAMAVTFNDLFLNGKADELPPLDALALYYEFPELTPVGAAGDQMTRNLAARLVKVDLLTQAAAMLEHQVKLRLEGEERSRVGADLAQIYLMNRQPGKAIETLGNTGYGQNPPELQLRRNHLLAQALGDSGQVDRALAVLDGDSTPEAAGIRIDLYWALNDWPNLIQNGEEFFASRQDPAQGLNKQESRALLQLAVAYVFQREPAQLQYLHDYFTPLLAADDPSLPAFLFLTGDSGPVDHEDFGKTAQDITNVQNFLSNYRAHEAAPVATPAAAN